MLTGRDVTDKLLPELKMPVLIVWGKQDQITPLSVGEKMHNLVPQSELDVIPGCGHLAPGQCAAEIGPSGSAVLEAIDERGRSSNSVPFCLSGNSTTRLETQSPR